MIKTLVTVIFATAVAATPVCAQFSGGSSTAGATSVADLKEQAGGNSTGLFDFALSAARTDDKAFVLVGTITAQLDGNTYVFKDSTGAINVEIDNFKGVKVTPNDTVRLTGEADYDDGLILEVDSISIVK